MARAAEAPRRSGRRSGLAAQVAPVAAISVFGLSIAMSHPLLALLLERMGASGLAIGMNTTAGAIAIVLLAPVLPRIMAALGMARMLVGAGLALPLLMLAFPLLPDYWAWTALRLVLGFCATALFFGSEFWIVATAPEGKRGRIVAVYTVSLSASFLVGPLLLRLTGVDGWLPFVVVAGVLLAGLVPLVWGLGSLPQARPEAPPKPLATLRFFVTDPVILWGVVLFGVIEYGAIALLPVWAVRTGLDEGQAVTVMATFAAGSILGAPLLGWAADRLDRRRLLLWAGIVSTAAPAGMIAAAGWLPGILAAGLAWGVAGVGLYALALTELGARYSGARLAEGNAAVVFAYGIGALVSPAALGQAMDLVPPDGLLWLAGGTALAYAGLVLVRIRRRPRGPAAGAMPLDSDGRSGR